STDRLTDELAAARALRGVNVAVAAGAPIAGRDVHRVLGRCRRLPHRPPRHLTDKQAYEATMKSSFTLEFATGIDPSWLKSHESLWAAGARDLRVQTSWLALLLRHESERIDAIKPPADVAGLQAPLATMLRAYADDLDK